MQIFHLELSKKINFAAFLSNFFTVSANTRRVTDDRHEPVRRQEVTSQWLAPLQRQHGRRGLFSGMSQCADGSIAANTKQLPARDDLAGNCFFTWLIDCQMVSGVELGTSSFSSGMKSSVKGMARLSSSKSSIVESNSSTLPNAEQPEYRSALMGSLQGLKRW